MQCWIYKSLRHEELYVYLKHEKDFEVLPSSIIDRLGKLEFVMELDLSNERKLAREDVNQVMDNLEKSGFHLQLPPQLSSEVVIQ